VNPGGEGEESGCGCRLVHPEGSAGALLGAMALAALAARRKRAILQKVAAEVTWARRRSGSRCR
jgi:MYXO-CTERM domain-containing protein